MSKLGNAISMLNLLSSGKKYSVSELARILEVSERIIHPLDLFYTSSSWAVAAYCELRCDLRHFELKRISSIEIMPEYFN